MNEELLWTLRKNKIVSMLKENKRLDDRAFDEFRQAKIQLEFSKCAEGSARVLLGKTDVIVGVKLGLAEPYADSPTEGSISCNVELLSMADASFEAGPPRPEAVEISRVVDRGIRESHCIDLESLCLVEGEKVWSVFIDANVLNLDGNMYDAVSLGAIASLLTAKVPKFEDGKIVKEEFSGKLKILNKPIMTSFAKINDFVLVDPNLAEEKVLDARFHVSSSEDNMFNACQKADAGSFKQNEIEFCLENALKKAKDLRKLL